MAKLKDFYKIFKLGNIQISESNIISKKIDLDDFQMNMTLSQRVDVENSVIEVNANIIGNSSKKENCFKFNISTFFTVDNITQFLKNEEFSLPKEFAEKLNEISLSNTRGVVLTFLSNTYFKDFIIPLIDFSKTKMVEDETN